MDYQEYQKYGANKGKKNDQVPENSRRKVATDYAVKQTLAVLGDFSSESEKDEKIEDIFVLAIEECEVTYHSLFSLMENTEDKEENKVTLSDIKEKLDNYSSRKIKKLVNVLIDSMLN